MEEDFAQLLFLNIIFVWSFRKINILWLLGQTSTCYSPVTKISFSLTWYLAQWLFSSRSWQQQNHNYLAKVYILSCIQLDKPRTKQMIINISTHCWVCRPPNLSAILFGSVGHSSICSSRSNQIITYAIKTQDSRDIQDSQLFVSHWHSEILFMTSIG